MKLIAGAVALITAIGTSSAFIHMKITEKKQSTDISIVYDKTTKSEQNAERLNITINGTTIYASFSENDATKELKEKLSQGDITIDAHDYGGFEKVGSLGFSLPRSDRQIQTECGDIMLYQGNQLTFFYESNSWSYTPIAHADIPQDELKKFLGNGDVSITLSMDKDESYVYTIDDAVLLQNYLLERSSDDLIDKPYDMNSDDRWNVFDLCLMKRQLLNNISEEESDTAVIYFSATSNTKEIAYSISEYLNADITGIEPLKPYTLEDIQYTNNECRANKEQNDESARPEIANDIDVSADVIYLGYPIWWGVEPRIIDTFLESYDLTGKTIIPFCTSGSSGISASETRMKKIEKDDVTWIAGKRFNANESDETIYKWIDESKSEIKKGE